MPANNVVVIGSTAVTILELTVGQIQSFFSSMASATPVADAQNSDPEHFSLVNDMLFQDVSLDEIVLMTTLSYQDLVSNDDNGYLPSDIQRVIDKMKAINPHFFQMRQRMLDITATMTNLTTSTPLSAA